MQRLKSRGQSTTETILVLPFFFLMVYGLLQACQMGASLIIVNYSASSIAQDIVQEKMPLSIPPNSPQGINPAKLEHFLGFGLYDPEVSACVENSAPTRNVTVRATAKLKVFPILSQFLTLIFRDRYTGGNGTNPNFTGGCAYDGDQNLGPFNFAHGGAYWKVRGKAVARMNYQS